MNQMQQDMAHVQSLVNDAFIQTGSLVALADGGQMRPEKMQRTLEQTMRFFENATLKLRQLCETYSPDIGGYTDKPKAPYIEVTGYAEPFGYNWFHISLNTLLPHCRYQSAEWLSDTIRRLLDDYENKGGKLPFYHRAMLVIDEHSSISGRHIYDQDNKGWKAVSNALKGRLIPDDDQYTLGITLLSTRSEKNVCHITLLDLADAGDFFSLHSGNYMACDFYKGAWT